MIIHQLISGRPAAIAYLTSGFEPATPDDYDIAKVVFDDGDIAFIAPPADPEMDGWNRHRVKHRLPYDTDPMAADEEMAGWNRHRQRHANEYVLPLAPEVPIEHQLAAWSKAVVILDASETMVRDLIERKLVGIASAGAAYPLKMAMQIMTNLMQSVREIRTEAMRTAFLLVRSQLGDRPIHEVTLSRWAATFLRDDLMGIEQAITAGLVAGLDSMEIARKVVGSMQLNGIDGVTQQTRHKIAHLGRAAIKQSNLRKAGQPPDITS